MRAPLLVAVLIAACTAPAPDDQQADAGAPPRTQLVEATVDGVARDFSARVERKKFAGQVTVHVLGYASDARYPALTLAFPGSVGRHGCDLPLAQGEVAIGFSEEEDATWNASNVRSSTCVIDVTRADGAGGRWAGTFSATIQDVKGSARALTAGRFDVMAAE